MKRLRQKIKRITANHIDLPKDVILDLPRMTIIGFYQLYIENYKGIIQFTEQYLHLRLTNKELKVIGEKLVIRAIFPEEIFIEGIIKEIKLID